MILDVELALDVAAGVPAQTGHQVAWRGFDSGRHFQDRVDPRKSLPSLDRADVHSVQPDQIGQLLLAEVGATALAPEVAAESHGQGRLHQDLAG
jgi:hypothetical protein